MAMVAAMKSVIAARVGDHQQHFGREDRIEAAHQVDAGGHHRGGVDQGADRRGALHGVGQPDVQGKLRALAHAAAEDPQPGHHQQPVALIPPTRHPRLHRHLKNVVEDRSPPGRRLDYLRHKRRRCLDYLRRLRPRGEPHHAVGHPGRRLIHRGPHLAENAGLLLAGRIAVIAEGKRPQARPHRHQADDHAEIADAVDDERLVGRVGGAPSLVVEADQQIRADADQLPEHEDHGQVAGDHQPQHAEAKQREVLEESGEPPAAKQRPAVGERHQRVGHLVELFVHVAERIDVDAGGHQRDHAKHGHRQGIDVVADGQLQRAEAAQDVPIAAERGWRQRGGVLGRLVRRRKRVVPNPVDQGRKRQHGRAADGQRGQVAGALAAFAHAPPQKTISAKEASGSSQASPRSFGSRVEKSMILVPLSLRERAGVRASCQRRCALTLTLSRRERGLGCYPLSSSPRSTSIVAWLL